MTESEKWFNDCIKEAENHADWWHQDFLIDFAELMCLHMQIKHLTMGGLAKKCGYKRSVIKKILQCNYNITLMQIIKISMVLRFKPLNIRTKKYG